VVVFWRFEIHFHRIGGRFFDGLLLVSHASHSAASNANRSSSDAEIMQFVTMASFVM
jgi:hypothetical protein